MTRGDSRLSCDMNMSRQTQPVRQRRRKRLWAVVGVCAVGLAGFGWYAYPRLTLRPTPRPDYWREQAAKLRPLPANALSITEAHAILNNMPFTIDPLVATAFVHDVMDVARGPWTLDRKDIKAVDALFRLPVFNDPYEDMAAALDRRWAERIPMSPEEPFPDFAIYRAWAKWLAAHSRWAWEQENNTTLAMRDWLMLLQLTKQCEQSPILISYFVSAAIKALAIEEMMIAALHADERFESRAFIQRALALFSPVPAPSDILEGERLCANSALEHLYVREGGDFAAVDEFVRWSNGAGWGGGAKRPSVLWNVLSPLFHDLPTARAAHDAFFTATDTCRDRIVCGMSDVIAALPPGAPRLSSLNTAYPGAESTSVRSIELFYRSQAAFEAALAMLALSTYRQDRNVYPDELSALVPDYLPRLPIDYADGKPLRYQNEGDRYLLYSLGTNGVDDGGVGHHDYPTAWERDGTPCPDVVFSLFERHPQQP